VNMKINDVIK